MTLTRVWIPSPNYSASRSQNRLLVLHTAEGATTFQGLGNYFASPGAQVSSHVGIDDTTGQIGEYVKPDRKTWTAFAGNDWGEHAELCGFAAWTRAQWLSHPIMLANTAQWLKEEAAHYSIPLVKVGAAEIVDGKWGVCGHFDLTQAGAGGNHWDPGPNFPWDVVLMVADVPTSPGPAPASPPPSQRPPVTPSAPAWPGRYLKIATPMMSGKDILAWQKQMKARGWTITSDGWYGSGSAGICRQFQAEKHLGVDGIVGPATWSAAWTAPR